MPKVKLIPKKDLDKLSLTEQEVKRRHEAFCQYYVNGDRETFGNGIQSYLKVYGDMLTTQEPSRYNNAKHGSAVLLKRKDICRRITQLLDEGGFNDLNVTKQHVFLLNQFEDLPTKMRAISDYNKLRDKYPAEKIEHTVITYDDKQREAIARRIIARREQSAGAISAGASD